MHENLNLLSSEEGPQPDIDQHTCVDSIRLRPENYRQAEAAAEELALTPNANNNDGVEDPDFMFFGAGSQQDRGLLVTGSGVPEGEPLNVSYRTKWSDRSSLEEKDSEILDQRTGLEDTCQGWFPVVGPNRMKEGG